MVQDWNCYIKYKGNRNFKETRIYLLTGLNTTYVLKPVHPVALIVSFW